MPALSEQLLPELLSLVFGFGALTPIRWVELCPSGGQVRPVLHEFLGCPHASDYAADAFLVANPVVLKALRGGGEFCRFHGMHPCCFRNRQQIESRLAQPRQKVQVVTYPWVA